MNFRVILAIIAFIAVFIFAFIYLKEPLEQRDIEGGKSVVFRIVLGVLLGVIVAFLIRI